MLPRHSGELIGPALLTERGIGHLVIVQAMATSDSLAARLIWLRAQAGLSQEQLAAAAKVSAQAISDIERGITLVPRLTTIERIVQALSLDASAGRELVGLRGLQGNPGLAAAGSPPDARPGADGNTAFAAANLSQAVTYLRVQQGLSIAELGRRSELSARTIADIEAGRRKRIHPASLRIQLAITETDVDDLGIGQRIIETFKKAPVDIP